MYRHVLVPIDCSQDSRFAAPRLAEFLSTMVPCQVTLVAVTSPAMTEEQRISKLQHAREALNFQSDIFLGIGVFTRHRMVENIKDGDTAAALAFILRGTQVPYDLILLSNHSTRQEEFDLPYAGSLADRICNKVNIPVMVMPTWQTLTAKTASSTASAKDIVVQPNHFS